MRADPCNHRGCVKVARTLRDRKASVWLSSPPSPLSPMTPPLPSTLSPLSSIPLSPPAPPARPEPGACLKPLNRSVASSPTPSLYPLAQTKLSLPASRAFGCVNPLDTEKVGARCAAAQDIVARRRGTCDTNTEEAHAPCRVRKRRDATQQPRSRPPVIRFMPARSAVPRSLSLSFFCPSGFFRGGAFFFVFVCYHAYPTSHKQTERSVDEVRRWEAP